MSTEGLYAAKRYGRRSGHVHGGTVSRKEPWKACLMPKVGPLGKRRECSGYEFNKLIGKENDYSISSKSN